MSVDQTLRERVLSTLSTERAKKTITVGPPLVWLLLLMFIPLVFLVTVSFATVSESYQIIWEFSVNNYVGLFQSGDLKIWQTPFFRGYVISLFIAVVTTVVTLLLALPVAYFLARQSGRVFKVVFYFVLLPFFTVYLVRAYSWYLMFGGSGVINVTLQKIGLIDQPLAAFDYGLIPIIITLAHAFFPYMLFTLYASFDGLDFSLVEAAQDLGATRSETFTDIVLPLVMPGIIGGSIFVFVPSLGAFVTPQIIGQSKIQMVGQLIGTRVNTLYAIGYGSAASLFIIIPTVIAFGIGFKYAAFSTVGGEQ